MTREDFKDMYYSMSNKELAKKLNVHPQTISNKAKRLELKPKGSGYQYPDNDYREKIEIVD